MTTEATPGALGSNDELGSVVLTDGAHSDALQCRWRSWRVVGPRALAVDLPPDNCTDMDGAIRVAEALMPGVREIHTFCDGVADTMYSCMGGQWQALTAQRLRQDEELADEASKQAAHQAAALLNEKPLSVASFEAAAMLLMSAAMRSYGCDDYCRAEFICEALDGHCPVCGQLIGPSGRRG